MRAFASVAPTIWTSATGREWRKLGAKTQVLGLYLITNPHTNNYGLYYLPMVVIVEETGIARPDVVKILETFAGDHYALYDEPSEWVWVQTMAARQLQIVAMPTPRDPRIAGVRKWYERCPVNPLLGPFFDYYEHLFSLETRRDGGRLRLPTSPEANGTALATITPRTRAIELFEDWWPHYPKASGKKAALGEWLKISPLPDEAFTAMCIHAVERQRVSKDWVKEGGKYIPDPERWLKKGRWDDRAVDLPMLSEGDAESIATLGAWSPPDDEQ